MDNRYYFSKDEIKDKYVKITGQEFIHLTKVRRAQSGDSITAFCLDGYDYNLTIEEIKKNEAICKVISKHENGANKKANIVVYLASIKQDALKEALDNLTQLNAKTIKIFDSVYTQVKYTQDKLEKLKLNMIQSAKQSERADIPDIKLLHFSEMIEDLKANDLNIFAYEDAKENINSIDISNYKNKRIGIIVGGEGGFSIEEVQSINKLANKVSMGRTILRAPVAVSCLYASVISDLGFWER